MEGEGVWIYEKEGRAVPQNNLYRQLYIICLMNYCLTDPRECCSSSICVCSAHACRLVRSIADFWSRHELRCMAYDAQPLLWSLEACDTGITPHTMQHAIAF